MEIRKVAVMGAGTMGAGIAQVCATAGFDVYLFDLNDAVLRSALGSLEENLRVLVKKEKITEAQKNQALQRIQLVSSLADIRADLMIEAIVEKLEPKQELFAILQQQNPDAILASNTSTFPIADISRNVKRQDLCVGLHFFNPATVMKLVEVISSVHTDPQVESTMTQFCKALGKIPVQAKDSPGFIVNRVARPFYVEALRGVEMELATFGSTDRLLRSTGFKMGPFELMDLIGLDVNLAVTTSLYNAFGQATRFTPSPLQQSKVQQGKLGRKSGEGFYEYPKQ